MIRLAKPGRNRQRSPAPTDSDEYISSSAENLKKNHFGLLKNLKKKKKKFHSMSEPEDSMVCMKSRLQSRSRSSSRIKLKGILKNAKKERDHYFSSEEDEDVDPVLERSIHRYLVGRVPTIGTRPGCGGGGLALVVKKKLATSSAIEPQYSSVIEEKIKRNWLGRRLSRKKSY